MRDHFRARSTAALAAGCAFSADYFIGVSADAPEIAWRRSVNDQASKVTESIREHLAGARDGLEFPEIVQIEVVGVGIGTITAEHPEAAIAVYPADR